MRIAVPCMVVDAIRVDIDFNPATSRITRPPLLSPLLVVRPTSFTEVAEVAEEYIHH